MYTVKLIKCVNNCNHSTYSYKQGEVYFLVNSAGQIRLNALDTISSKFLDANFRLLNYSWNIESKQELKELTEWLSYVLSTSGENLKFSEFVKTFPFFEMDFSTLLFFNPNALQLSCTYLQVLNKDLLQFKEAYLMCDSSITSKTPGLILAMGIHLEPYAIIFYPNFREIYPIGNMIAFRAFFNSLAGLKSLGVNLESIEKCFREKISVCAV